MINVQEYINQNYPKEERKNITNLEINDKKLEGHLDLSDFVNLEELDCSENELTSIDLSNNRKIKLIDCSDNLLTDIDFSYQDHEKLEGIFIQDNNLSARSLSSFLRFTKLQYLLVGNYDDEKINQGIYNRFHGSLEYLKNLKELVELDISGTDINTGLEYLPLNNLASFCCASQRTGAGVEEIKNTLDLSEEKALSEREEDNSEKISKIGAYQAYVNWQQRILEMRQVQVFYWRSLSNFRLALRRVGHKLDGEHLQFLLSSQATAIWAGRVFPMSFQYFNDKLRQIKQELIEDFEELTKGEIDNLCRAQIQFTEARVLFSQIRQQQQGMENLIQVYTLLRR